MGELKFGLGMIAEDFRNGCILTFANVGGANIREKWDHLRAGDPKASGKDKVVCVYLAHIEVFQGYNITMTIRNFDI